MGLFMHLYTHTLDHQGIFYHEQLLFIYFFAYVFAFLIFPLFVQSLSHVQLFVTSWTATHQASLSFTISQSLLRFMSTESMMPSNHLSPQGRTPSHSRRTLAFRPQKSKGIHFRCHLARGAGPAHLAVSPTASCGLRGFLLCRLVAWGLPVPGEGSRCRINAGD